MDIKQNLQKSFGLTFEPELVDEIIVVGSRIQFQEEESIIRPGDYLTSIPLILEGIVKILRSNADGDEMFLYHLEKGETCAVSITCCTSQTRSEIRAVTETQCDILMIPVKFMEYWSSKYKSWRTFIFRSYHARLMQQYESIDTLAFSNLEERLISYLIKKGEVLMTKNLNLTHQNLADDLNTNRVVISRLLKKLEHRGYLKLDRNNIMLM